MGFGYVFGATPVVMKSANLRLKLLNFSGGRPNQGSPLKFEVVYPLVIFFDRGFFEIFQRIFLSSNIQTIIFNPVS
jgi:hypothetical protein